MSGWWLPCFLRPQQSLGSEPLCGTQHTQFGSDFATPWAVAHKAPLSMGSYGQEYWGGLPCPSPEDLPDPRIKPASPVLSGGHLTSEPPGKPIQCQIEHHAPLVRFLFISHLEKAASSLHHTHPAKMKGGFEGVICQWVFIEYPLCT